MGIRAVVFLIIGVTYFTGYAQAESLGQKACETGAQGALKACLATGIPCVPENSLCNTKPHHGNETQCNAIYNSALNRCQPTFNWNQTPLAPQQPNRYGAAFWRDLNGGIWLFGGADQLGTVKNDLFTFRWGASLAQTGWQPVASSSGATPSARMDATTALDPVSGVLWLFGGIDGGNNRLNDLWTFTVSGNGTGSWTQISTGTVNGFPDYGVVLGAPCAGPGRNPVSVTPGGRYGAVAWVDSSHHLWVFGGAATDCTNLGPYVLNDLWQFALNGAGSGGTWSWSPTPYTQSYAGGCLGSGPGTTPGGRQGASYWTDSSGAVWVFGGYGFGASSAANCQTAGGSLVSGYLNDLWKYVNGQWTLIAGPPAVNQLGIYGTKAVPAATNVPPSRAHATSWKDSRGNFWIFGGGSAQLGLNFAGYNDLWEFVYDTRTWIWIGGSQGVVQSFGNFTGPGPGPRAGAAGGAIGDTDFWLYGGFGANATVPTPFPNSLNDLWRGTGIVYDWP